MYILLVTMKASRVWCRTCEVCSKMWSAVMNLGTSWRMYYIISSLWRRCTLAHVLRPLYTPSLIRCSGFGISQPKMLPTSTGLTFFIAVVLHCHVALKFSLRKFLNRYRCVQIYEVNSSHTHTHTHNHFTALFPGPLGWASAKTELLDFMI